MAGYGNGAPASVPGIPGSIARQGGYIDSSGVSHTYASDPGAYNALVQAVGGSPIGGGTQAAPQPRSPFDSDPAYAAALAQQQLGIGTINSNLNSQIAQRIAAYGDPNLAAMAGFGLDPQAAAFARQNYLSGNADLARIDRQHNLARQAIINRLAGHGLLDSGDTGYLTGQEDQNYGNNVYDSQQKALADILGYRTDALNRTTSLHDAVNNALESVYVNYLNHPELGGYGLTPQQQQQQLPLPVNPPKTQVSAPKPKLPSSQQIAAALKGLNRGLAVIG